MRIGVIGASGFIGRELVKALKEKNYDFRSFSRTYQPKQNWRFIDLFSKSITEESLEGIDIAVYLVHSMSPSSRLTQGNFGDIDLLLADNFIRACKKNNIQQIVYLSGIVPKENHLSMHLRSRKEIEDLFESSGINTTVIRSGMIVGDKGSSLNIIKNIILKSPIILVPPQMYNQTQIVLVEDVVKEIIKSFDNDHNQVKNLGYEPISYVEMMKLIQKQLGRNQLLINIKWYPVKLLSFITCLITKAPYNLVRPLFESLKHNMVSGNVIGSKNELAIKSINKNDKTPYAFNAALEISKVRSVQRIVLGREIYFPIYKIYYRWLKRKIPILGIKVHREVLDFYLIHPKIKLLQLTYAPTHSSQDRQLMFITGGLLSSKGQDYGRLEFRIVRKNTIIVAIHDYIPALPWWIYIFTQAQIHLFVMNRFKKFMAMPKDR